ncbi:hypothetical protein LTR85_009998 [Meristemomyces frigidus]|nr:hypothetical protein LTR85_009998 [Meristemomyces frigidus]
MSDIDDFGLLPFTAVLRLDQDDVRRDLVKRGVVLWLPPVDIAEEKHNERTRSPGCGVLDGSDGYPVMEGMFRHPILVIDRPEATPNKVLFCLMTSFRGQTLERRFAREQFRIDDYVPVQPSSPHPRVAQGDRDYRTLTLKRNVVVEKAGYVQINKVYIVDIRDAQRYWAPRPAGSNQYCEFGKKHVDRVLRLVRDSTGFRASTRQHQTTLTERVGGNIQRLRRWRVWKGLEFTVTTIAFMLLAPVWRFGVLGYVAYDMVVQIDE